MNAMPDLVIRSMTFQLDGSVAIEYVTPKDFKSNGLQQSHVVLVPVDTDYDSELESLDLAATALLKDALEDFDLAEDFDFDEDEDDFDDDDFDDDFDDDEGEDDEGEDDE